MTGTTGLIFSAMAVSALAACSGKESAAPNILICIADDASFPHIGNGCDWISTPAFDRIARQGINFTQAYTPNAKSAPSRACILTGRNPWQLKDAANQFCYFPAEFTTYPEVLREHGYFVGYTGKGWLPGDPGTVNGKRRELLGREWNSIRTKPPTQAMSRIDYAANFQEFYRNKPDGEPFCFWYGSHEPHRRYVFGSSLEAGRAVSEVDIVPAFLPDNNVVRTDLLDYGLEIEYFDSHTAKILAFLEEQGELDNTIVIATADNGMSFPRAKSDAYEYSNHIPLAIMWKDGIKGPGRRVDDPVSFIDLAPTILDLAGIRWNQSGMEPTPGKSLKTYFQHNTTRRPLRKDVLIGKERHGVGRPDDSGYPIRGIVRDGWLLVVNYSDDLWPLGNPETGYPDVDGSPSKTEVLRLKDDPEGRIFWEMTFDKRPGTELYNIADDPGCMKNLAGDPAYSGIMDRLRNVMEKELINEGDPRMAGEGDLFNSYESSDSRWRDTYNRMIIRGEKVVLPWIDQTDIEPLPGRSR